MPINELHSERIVVVYSLLPPTPLDHNLMPPHQPIPILLIKPLPNPLLHRLRVLPLPLTSTMITIIAAHLFLLLFNSLIQIVLLTILRHRILIEVAQFVEFDVGDEVFGRLQEEFCEGGDYGARGDRVPEDLWDYLDEGEVVQLGGLAEDGQEGVGKLDCQVTGGQGQGDAQAVQAGFQGGWE